MISISTQNEDWEDNFGQLHGILLSDLPLSRQLKLCADTLRRQQAVNRSPYLQRQIEEGISTMERAAEGDYAAISRQFRNLVHTPLEETELDHFLVLIVKDID